MFRHLILFLCAFHIFIFNAYASYTGTPLDHAPIGVMAEHRHKQGEWMVSYRHMYMDMNQNYSGTKQLSIDQVHDDYMLAPVRMSMEMHMLGFMYGLNDDVTLMAMIPHITKNMEHRRRDDAQFSARSQGIGDVRLSAIVSLRELVSDKLQFNFGVSVPTGSINRKDRTLLGPDQDLPYPMQLGSGTYDILPGLTYSDQRENWSWGAQLNSTIHLGVNELKYQLGDRYEVTSWAARQLADWVSASLRLSGQMWGNVSGADQRLNPAMIQTADANLQGGKRIDALAGLNFLGKEGVLEGHRLALEFGVPVYQDLNGPQLGAGFFGTIGWQKAF